MGLFSTQVIQLGSHVVSSMGRRAAQEQGGLLSGKDPTEFNTDDPIRLWIIQLGIIIATTQLLSLVLSKLRQPRVIAEVICGIILGPTVMGRVPGFSDHIFPKESRSYLNLTATIGLVLFLFLVGLEIDLRVIKRNAKSSAIIGIGAICLPLGMGFGLAVPIYREFINSEVSTFSHFALFVAVAYSITAFPVLCRILTELKILDTTIGIVVLSAGVGNDIIGWTLLALSIALVNAGSGITALYILLVAIGWTLVILIPVKKFMYWLARWTGSIENGPTPLMMTVSIMVMFSSAFFTDVIGVHAIFGAFLAGLVIPHEGGLAIALTEKLEDLTSIIFLPLYFTLSGLSTDLGLLNTGKTWGYTILIIITAYIGKFIGGTFGGRAAGYQWRESAVIGTLLSCKGLVELIVLNIGLNAGVLTPRVFAMFVLEALTLTFMTTPVTIYLYPPHLRQRAVTTGPNFSSAEEGKMKKRESTSFDSDSLRARQRDGLTRTRLTVVLDKIDHVPALMTITRFLQPFRESAERPPDKFPPHRVTIDALRLMELSERTSAMMKSAVADELMQTDSLITLYRTFGDLHDVPVAPSLTIVPQDSFAYSVAEHARDKESDMIVLSWLAPGSAPLQATGTVPSTPAVVAPGMTPGAGEASGSMYNPFDALFRAGSTSVNVDSSSLNTQFVRRVFSESTVDVALYVDRSSLRSKGLLGVAKGVQQHILLPFFGGPDDRLALDFVVQLCAHPGITASIIRMKMMEAAEVDRPSEAQMSAIDPAAGFPAGVLKGPQHHTITSIAEVSIRSGAFPDTVYPHATTQTRLESDTADNLAWMKHSAPVAPSPTHSRIEFMERSTPLPLHTIIEMMDGPMRDKRLIVAVGRARRLAMQSHHDELKMILSRYSGGTAAGNEVRKTVGDVAAGLLVGSTNNAALIVLQAAEEYLSR